MSFAEENGHDIYDWDDIPDTSILELKWKRGKHITKDGREMSLKKMSDSHLENTIKYFGSHDTTPLEEEQKRRKLLSTNE